MDLNSSDIVISGSILMIVWGGALVFSMHAGFGFLEAGTVRGKNVSSALAKIGVNIAIAGLAYFLVGYLVSYGIWLPAYPAASFGTDGSYQWGHFFYLLTFAAAAGAIISGGVAERMRLKAFMIIIVIVHALIYPAFESWTWGGGWLAQLGYHDYAGSGVVHGISGFLGLMAAIMLGPRLGLIKNGRIVPPPPGNVAYVALGSWFLATGWFGFNVGSALTLPHIEGLVAANTFVAIAAGGMVAGFLSKWDTPTLFNGFLVGAVAITGGSDVVHPLAAILIGGVGATIFVYGSRFACNHRIDDPLGVWSMHGLGGVWGVFAAGIFGLRELGGLGGVNPLANILGIGVIVAWTMTTMGAICLVLRRTGPFRATAEEEEMGLDLAEHKLVAEPEFEPAVRQIVSKMVEERALDKPKSTER